MRKLKILLVLLYCIGTLKAQQTTKTPNFLLGEFKDDYGITYNITDTVWIQNPKTKYQILAWHPEKQYLIAKNDSENNQDAGKYTRIDYMTFAGMEPYQWGFCLTVYNAETDKVAEETASADRQNPKKGCGGYPFSRMMKITTTKP